MHLSKTCIMCPRNTYCPSLNSKFIVTIGEVSRIGQSCIVTQNNISPLLTSDYLHYIYTCHNVVTVWHGVMFIRQGVYSGSVLRFQLFIPDTYPDADCPVSLVIML